MPAIISENFRIFNAKQFLESLSEGSNNTEATTDERTKSYFFVGRPQKWASYLEIYSNSGSFTVGEQVYVTGTGITLSNSPFKATVEAVYPNSLLLNSIGPIVSAIPSLGAQIRGNSSSATAICGVYRYGTDEIPTRPLDNQEEEDSIHDDMIAMKRISPDQVRAVTRRYNWNLTINPKFDMWRPDYSSAYPSTVDPDGAGPALAPTSLGNAKYYVINNNYEVFKCIYNGVSVTNPNGKNAALEPTRNPGPSGQGVYDSATGIFTEYPDVTDGYIWKYMYTIPTADVLRFLSTDFIPIVEDVAVKTLAASQNGSIMALVLRNAGSNLPASQTLYARILGNGSNGRVKIETTAGGAIDKISLANSSGSRVNVSGSGYTYANVILANGFLFANPDFTSPVVVSANATGHIEVVIPPKGGHGSDPIKELSGKRIMANIRLTYAEGSGDFPVDNDFRRIGIITNPKLPSPSTDYATAETLTTLYALKLNNVSIGFTPDEIIQQEVSAGLFAKGTVVSWIWDEVPAGQTPSSGVLKYFQSSDYHLDQGIVRPFISDASKIITGQSSLITGNVEATYSTGGAVLPLAGMTFTGGLASPEVAKYTGQIIYIENRRLITRAPDQIEDIKLVIEF